MLEGYIVPCQSRRVIRIIRSSKTREEAKIKLLAFEWTRAQVEKWGILIRRAERMSAGRTR